MNILYLNHNVVGKSTYYRCFGFARELALLGHSVTILTNSEKGRIHFHKYIKDKVHIVETPDLLSGNLRTGWDPVNVARRCQYLRNKSFDLIHAFDTRPTVILPALFYKRFIKNVPLIIDWADWWGRGGAISLRPNKLVNILFSPIETFFEEYFRHYADFTTVISTLLYKRAIKLGISKKLIRLIYSGADVRDIYPENKKTVRIMLKLPLDSHICVFPGFVLYDLKIVLDTFLILSSQDPKAVLLLIGDYPDDFRSSYISYIREGKIKIIGKVNKIRLRSYLSASDVGIMPLSDNLANQARFPGKFGDFLASGLPVVTNEVGDVGKLVKKYKTAYLCKFSAEDMAKQIKWLISNPQLTSTASFRIRQFAINTFSWKYFAKILIKIYEDIILEY